MPFAAQLDLPAELAAAQQYLAELLQRAIQGDPLTLLVLAFGALLLLGITARITLLLWRVLKRLFLLGVAGYSLYYVWSFTTSEAAKAGGYQNLPPNTLALAALGVLLGLVTLVLGLAALVRHGWWLRAPALAAAPAGRARAPSKKAAHEYEEEERNGRAALEENIADRVAARLSQPVAGAEKSLLAVLAYLIVAEFGVFSSFTTAAPTPQVGLGFFVVFVLGALLFLRNNYKDYNRGLLHLGFALVIGFALSVVLGHYWNNIPLAELLSINYFKTSSLVALVTGVAVSLVLGSKG